jgi:3-phenylpropionate/cinnamic acid dioxygenase small subunit
MAVTKSIVDYYFQLTDLVNKKNKWDAFNAVLDNHILFHQKTLEQSADEKELFKAQGAITALRKLKYLKEEVNGAK